MEKIKVKWIPVVMVGCALLLGAGCGDDSTSDLDGSVDLGPSPDLLLDGTMKVDGPAADLPRVDMPQGKADQAVAMDKGKPPLPDTSTPDMAKPADKAVTGDAAGAFPYNLEGVWLVGWIGGINRFSWVSFTVTSKTGGKAKILAGSMSGGTIPYWNCTGSTSWNTTSKVGTIQLHFPSSTCHPSSLKSTQYTFAALKPYSGTYPKGATHQASITTSPGTPATVTGYKYPASQCDTAMTTCKDPFKP